MARDLEMKLVAKNAAKDQTQKLSEKSSVRKLNLYELLGHDDGLTVQEKTQKEKDVEEEDEDEGEEEDNCIPTPAGTSTVDDDFESATINLNVCPWPGQTFVIRDSLAKGVITLEDGELVLRGSERSSDRGSHWHCEQNEFLWLGFRNAVSGTYIGHNNRGKCIARAKEHLEWESLCTRQRQGGEHVLLMKNGSGFRPVKLQGFSDTPLVLDRNTDLKTVSAWEFIKVGQK